MSKWGNIYTFLLGMSLCCPDWDRKASGNVLNEL